MRNIAELRDELFKVFEELRDGSLTPKQAAEINNCAGKIINSVKVELDYHALRHAIKDNPPTIKFIEYIK